MGAFGSVIGGIMAMASLFLGGSVIWTFTDSYYILSLFLIFGILGGIPLGALNGRKARTQAKYRNEYMSYFGMFLAAIIFLGLWFALFGEDNIDKNLDTEDYSAIEILGMAIASGLLALFGLGLVVANSIADSR